VVERCIFCVHGGIGRVKWLRQIEQITKPCAGVQELISQGDKRGPLLTDILWSDPSSAAEQVRPREMCPAQSPPMPR
jgi:hypothetical protein